MCRRIVFFAVLALLFWLPAGASDVSSGGKTGWTPLMYGSNQDSAGDSQAKSGETDIVGDASHGSLYTAYDTHGTASTAENFSVVAVSQTTDSHENGGASTEFMSASQPVAAGPGLTISTPGNGSYLNAVQNSSVSVSGISTSLDGITVTVTVSDSANTTVTGNSSVATNDWSGKSTLSLDLTPPLLECPTGILL
jgi:large repetitive protein